MKQAITKAIEGGYQPKIFGYANGNFSHKNEVIWCDPAFWQALGKAEGWNGANFGNGRETLRSWVPHWKDMWHRFIDKIASGGTAEEFFTELFTNTK